jgi:S-adenosyl-L-methionine hydrolase (adenosine-forming)
MLITLTTDFGYQDPFVGIMKGVILGINPQAQVVDLSHGIPPQDILAGALLIQHAVPYFPRGTIHMVVVDPGVGGSRSPLLIECEGNYLLGPDNGVLSLAVEGKTPARVIRLSNTAYQLQPTSATFHGRDVFASTAAHLSLGIAREILGESTHRWVRLPWSNAAKTEHAITGKIVYIDAFGNLFTNIRADDLDQLPRDKLKVILNHVSIHRLAQNYAAVAQGDYVALINSWGLLEVAVYKDNAQKRSGAMIGDKVEVAWDL